MKQLTKHDVNKLTTHKGAIVVCALAALAITLSLVSYVHTRNYIALEDTYARYQLVNRLYHHLDDEGKLTNQDKQTVLPLLLWAGSAWMERDWDKTTFYLNNAAMVLEEANNRDNPLTTP